MDVNRYEAETGAGDEARKPAIVSATSPSISWARVEPRAELGLVHPKA